MTSYRYRDQTLTSFFKAFEIFFTVHKINLDRPVAAKGVPFEVDKPKKVQRGSVFFIFKNAKEVVFVCFLRTKQPLNKNIRINIYTCIYFI